MVENRHAGHCFTWGSCMSRSRSKHVLFVLFSSLFLQACVLHTMFGTGAEFDEAVKAGNWERAGRIHAENPDFFTGKQDTFGAQLAQVRDALNQIYHPRLARAIDQARRVTWPQSPNNWPGTRADFRTAKQDYDNYNQYLLTRSAGHRLIEADRLKSILDRLEQDMRADAPGEFEAFDHFAGQSFFDSYPLALNAPGFLSLHYSRIESQIKQANLSQMEQFLGSYPIGKTLTGTARDQVRTHYLARLTRHVTGRTSADLDQFQEILKRAARFGIDRKAQLKRKVAVVELKPEENNDRLSFPLDLDRPKQFTYLPAQLRNAADHAAAKRADYVLIIDPAASAVSRIKLGGERRSSRYYSHSTYASNPAYANAQNSYLQAQAKRNQAELDQQIIQNQVQLKEQQLKLLKQQQAANNDQSEATKTLIRQIQDEVTDTRTRANTMNNARRKSIREAEQAQKILNSTPAQLEQKHYAPYRFQMETARLTRRMTINYFLLDRATGKLSEGQITRKESKRFKQALDLRDDDPDRSEILKKLDGPQDVKEWSEKALDLDVDDLLADYSKSKEAAVTLPGRNALNRKMIRMRDDAVAALARHRNSNIAIPTQPHSKDADSAPVQAAEVEYRFPKGPRNGDAFAVIIATSNYRNGDIPRAEFALNDGEAMRQLLIKTFGYDEENVVVLRDPQQSELMSYFGTRYNHQGRLHDIIEREGIREIYIYYSGHGVPGEGGKGLILPSDADPYKAQLTGYSLETLINNLNKLPNVHTTLAIDSCFSGVSEAGSLVRNASPVFLSNSLSVGGLKNGVILTAADGSEIASWDRETGHGLFTRHLIEGYLGRADRDAGNRDGRVDLSEMTFHLRRQLSREARRLYSRRQTPQIQGDPQQLLNKTLNRREASLPVLMERFF